MGLLTIGVCDDKHWHVSPNGTTGVSGGKHLCHELDSVHVFRRFPYGTIWMRHGIKQRRQSAQ